MHITALRLLGHDTTGAETGAAAETDTAADPDTAAADRARDLERHVGEFLAGLGAGTRRCYVRDLGGLGAYLAGRGLDLASARRAELARWVADQEASGCSPATICRRMSAVSGLYRYLVAEGVLARSPAEGLRRPRGGGAVRLGLDADELRSLLGAGRGVGPDAELLVSLLLFAALRVGEACGLDDTDLVTHEGRLGAAVRRKGGRVELVGLPEPLPGLVADALARHGPGPLLRGPRGRRLRPEAAWRIIGRLGEQAGIPRAVHPHLLRHSYVSHALLAGVALPVVAAGAGHRDIRTTVGYARALAALGGTAGEAVASRVGA